MLSAQRSIVPVDVDGVTVYVEVTHPVKEGETQSNVSGKRIDFDEVAKSITAISNQLAAAFSKVTLNPTKTAVEFGIELEYQSGQLLAIFVQGSTNINFKITLEWEKKP